MEGEVFRGHLPECIMHFGKWFGSRCPKGKKGRHDALKPMSDFCGITPQTAQRLMDSLGEGSPAGETLCKLYCYLDLHGYRVIEFERLEQILRCFSELIGFGLFSAEEGAQLCGYPNAGYLYRVLHGEIGLSKDKGAKMWTIWKDRKAELEEKKRKALKSSRLEILFKKSTPLFHGPTSGRDDVFAILRSLNLSFEAGLFNNLSEDELVSIETSHHAVVFQSVNHLTALASQLLRVKDRVGGEE